MKHTLIAKGLDRVLFSTDGFIRVGDEMVRKVAGGKLALE